MYPPVLEHLGHEGKSAPSNTRADQLRVPSCSVPCVVLTAVSAWLLRIVDLWPLPGSGEKQWGDQQCWVPICL